jgi:23S rRNA pseudouridine1911/1915/1917 synthase
MKPGTLELEVEAAHAGERLDRFVVGQLPALSRAAIQRLIKDELIRVNGRKTKANHLVRAGESVTVTVPEPRATEVRAEAIPLDVLFEDEDLLVVNKPPGMTVHPAVGNLEHTLVNALLHHCAGSLSGIGGELRPGIVHRLDKDTSGCMVVAKSDAAHQALSEQFQGREVTKIYLALVAGSPRRDSGVIQANIGRHRIHRQKMAVDHERGRRAVTEYRVVEHFAEHALLEASIHTGRTHQIRVHLSWLGHPVLGDATYGKKTHVLGRDNKAVIVVPRQMLHAWRLGFKHPRTGKPMQFEAPLPKDIQDVLQQIRNSDMLAATRLDKNAVPKGKVLNH